MAVLGRDCERLGGDDNSVVRELRATSATGVSYADARHAPCSPAITHNVSGADTGGHGVAHSDAHSHAGADPPTDSGHRADSDRRGGHGELYHYLRQQ
jgi:hypothetical protein